MNDDEIEILASLRDEVSGPARRAARSVDELGDEAQQTAAQLEAMGAAADDSADDLDELDRAARRAARSQAAQRRATAQQRDEFGRFVSAADRATDATDAATAATNKNTSANRRNRRSLISLQNPFGWIFKILKKIPRLAFFSIKWIAIATGISFLGTAIKGLGAAGYAGVAGLAPLTGLLIAYPGYLSTLLQVMGTIKMATGGVGNLVGVLADPASTIEDIREATKGMGKEQIAFAQAVADQADEWKSIRRTIGNTFFDDMDSTFENMAKDYLPIIEKRLDGTARSLNDIMQDSADWLTSAQGMKDIDSILASNVVNTDNLGHGFLNLTRLMTILVRTAGPMLRRMSGDFEDWSGDLADSADDNRKSLRKFFLGAYDLYLDVFRVTGYYMKALYNIGKLSGVLNKSMGNDLDELGQQFLAWTESKGGKKDIRTFFREMIPVVKELGYWIRDLSSAFSDISMENDDFLTASRALRTKALPELVDFWEGVVDRVVPAMEEIGDTYADFKESGAIGGFGRALEILWNVVKTAGKIGSNLPDSMKKLLAVVATIYSLYKVAQKIGPLNKAMLGATGGRFGNAGIQNVRVMNWPPGMMTKGSVVGAPKRGTPVVAGAPKHRGPGIFSGAVKRKSPVALVPRIKPDGSKKLIPGIARNTAGSAAKAAGTGAGLAAVVSKLKGWRPGMPTTIVASIALGSMDDSYIKRMGMGALFGSLAGPWGAVGGAALGGFSKHISDSNARARGMTANLHGKNGIGGELEEYNKSKAWVEKYGQYGPSAMRTPLKDGPKPNPAAKGGWQEYEFSPKYDMMQAQNEKFIKERGIGIEYYQKLISALPKEVQTKFTQPGMAPSQSDIKKLLTSYALTPKQKQTVLRALGANQAETEITRLRNAIDSLRDKTVRINIERTETLITKRSGGIGKGEDAFGKPSFTGNPYMAGETHMVGELGPEAFISRSGKISMIGKNGPHLFRSGVSGAILPSSVTFDPTSQNTGNAPDWAVSLYRKAASNSAGGGAGAVIPASMTSDPYNGSAGLTPQWAADAYRRAAEGAVGTMKSPDPQPVQGGGDSFSVSTGPIYASSDVDVERAVTKALRKMQRERQERS